MQKEKKDNAEYVKDNEEYSVRKKRLSPGPLRGQLLLRCLPFSSLAFLPPPPAAGGSLPL